MEYRAFCALDCRRANSHGQYTVFFDFTYEHPEYQRQMPNILGFNVVTRNFSNTRIPGVALEMFILKERSHAWEPNMLPLFYIWGNKLHWTDPFDGPPTDRIWRGSRRRTLFIDPLDYPDFEDVWPCADLPYQELQVDDRERAGRGWLVSANNPITIAGDDEFVLLCADIGYVVWKCEPGRLEPADDDSNEKEVTSF